jgi:hypothetical protein
LKSFNYTPYLFSKKVEKTALYRDNFFIVSGLCPEVISVTHQPPALERAFTRLENYIGAGKMNQIILELEQ